MKFNEFCKAHGVTSDERPRLREFVGFLRFREILSFLADTGNEEEKTDTSASGATITPPGDERMKTKTVYGKDRTHTYAFRLDGVAPDYFNQAFGRQLDDQRKIKLFQSTAKTYHVGAKRRATLAAVKEWVKDKQPDQFFARWMSDSSQYKDDSVEVWYTGGVTFPSASDTTVDEVETTP